MQVVNCTENTPLICLKKFIPSRRDQPDICVKCLVHLGIDEAFPPIKGTSKKGIWS